MIEIMRQIFGASLSEMNYTFPSGTPAYIIYGYSVSKCKYFDKNFLVASPVGENWNLGTIKKHVQKIEEIGTLPCVIDLPQLTALQRTNLIENQIAFISGSGQIFLPFLGCYFEEKIAEQVSVPETMNATAQMVFLYIFYNSKDSSEQLNLTQIANALGISKATCSRALKQLLALNLVTAEDVGVAKLIRLSGNRQDVIRRALPVMSSPVSKTLYVKELPENIEYRICNVKALSEISMIAAREADPGISVSVSESKVIAKETMISYQDFIDFGGYVIEVWKYDPLSISNHKYVDEISLLLELSDNEDERIQNCLDEIRNKYGIEVNEEW